MKKYLTLTLFLFVAIVVTAQDAFPPVWRVTKVVDGDTFYAKRAGERVKFRLIGIDTPEFSHFGRPEEPFAQEATDHLKSLINNKPVWLVYDVQAKDRYNRDLVYVYSPDQKTLINMEMVKAGWASPMTIAPNVAHAEAFVAAHRIARAEGRGIWKEGVEEQRCELVKSENW